MEEADIGYGGSIRLADFDPARLNYNQQRQGNRIGTIEAAYDAAMVGNKHRLHDAMVVYLANLCSLKGAEVFEDPSSVDLLVRYQQTEYLIEVKSINSKNYVKRLRYAIGQLFHYDYMLSPSSQERKKVLALPNLLPASTSIIPFFNTHLGMDLLSLTPTSEGQTIRCDSNDSKSRELFSDTQ